MPDTNFTAGNQIPTTAVAAKAPLTSQLANKFRSRDIECIDAIATTNAAVAALQAHALGVGQTWQDVTGSRSANASYTNSTGYPISVTLTITETAGFGSTATCAVIVGGVTIFNVTSTDPGTGPIPTVTGTVTFIVPNGVSYSTSASGATPSFLWVELR